MANLSKDTRRMEGCGYEPAWEHARPDVTGYTGPKLTVCAGYSTNLPEVIEAARGWSHWKNGELTSFARGMPTEALIESIEHFNGAVNECQSWCVENREGGK
jgi:hypothetical protein